MPPLNLNTIGNALSLNRLPPVAPPTTVTKVTPMTTPVIPTPTVTTPNISTAVANTEASKVVTTSQQDAIARAAEEETARKLAAQAEATKSNESLLAKIMGTQKDPTAIYEQAKIDEGLTQKLEQRQTQEAKIASLTKSYQDYKNEVEKQKDMLLGQGRGITQDVLSRQASEIDRMASYKLNTLASEINFESAMLSIYNENYSEAKSSAEQAVQYALAGQKNQLDMYKMFYDEHLSNFEKVDSIYKDAYESKMKMLELDYQESEKNKTYASEAALKYNSMGAGITLNDTPDQVNAKIASVGGELGYYAEQQKAQQKYSTTKTGFTNAQILNGTENSGLSQEEFTSLPVGVQNFFVNAPQADINDLTGTINQLEQGIQTLDEANAVIDSIPVSTAVKNYFKELAKASVPQKAEEGSWWDKLKFWN